MVQVVGKEICEISTVDLMMLRGSNTKRVAIHMGFSGILCNNLAVECNVSDLAQIVGDEKEGMGRKGFIRFHLIFRLPSLAPMRKI